MFWDFMNTFMGGILFFVRDKINFVAFRMLTFLAWLFIDQVSRKLWSMIISALCGFVSQKVMFFSSAEGEKCRLSK